MITGIADKSFHGAVHCAEIGILQAGSEAVTIGAHIEEVHGSIKLMVRAIDRAETLDDIMMNHAKVVPSGHGKILVTAQVVIAHCEAVVDCRLEGDFPTGHPGIDFYAILVIAELVIIGGLGNPTLGVEQHVCSQQMLEPCLFIPSRMRYVILHADVHEQQRRPQGKSRQVIVIPRGMQGFVGLCTITVVRAAAVHHFSILVIS